MFAVLESSFNKNAFRYISVLNAMVLDLEISKDTHFFFQTNSYMGPIFKKNFEFIQRKSNCKKVYR